jgi:hypothetical protein
VSVALAALGLHWLGREPPSLPRVSGAPPSASAPVAPPEHALLATHVEPERALPALDAEASLREIDALSRTDKPRALELALEADRRLPPVGVMAEARRAVIVTLLAELDRLSEARARARNFGAEYPNSRYLPLVQGVTGVHPRPRPSELRDARLPR